MAQPTPSSPSQPEAEAEAPSSPPTSSSSAQPPPPPLAPQSPYVVISSSSSRDRPSRRLRIPSDYSNDGAADPVIAATGEGAPLLASRRDLAQRDGGSGAGARASIYALQDGDGTNAQQPLPGTGIIRRPRPRFWYLLPLLSLLDVLLETLVSFPLLFPTTSTNPSTTKPNPDNPSGSIDSTRTRTLAATLLSACMLRCATLSIISIGNRTDQLGLIVAGVCAASALVGVSVFNLLFQEGLLSGSPTPSFFVPPSPSWTSNLPPPSLTLLTSLGLGFTVLEYILYVIVVGIRVPPSQGQAGGVRRMGDVRRWKRGVRAVVAGQHGQGGGSDWSVYMDEEGDDEEGTEGAEGSEEPSRKRRRASYVESAGTTLTPGSSGNLEPGSSGSKSSSLLLLPETALTTPPPTSTSYGALEASRPLSSLLPQSAFSAASTAAEGSVRGGNGGGGGDRRRTTSTTSTRSRGGLDTALPTSSSTSPAGSTGRVRLSASPSRSPSANPAPVDLEAGTAAVSGSHSDAEDDEGDEEEDADPNEILDIPSFPSSTSRDASRMRLAMASEPASGRGRRLSAIRGGDESRDEEEREEVVEHEQVEEVVAAVPQRRRGWRTGGGGGGAGGTSLLPFKRKKPQRGESGTPSATVEEGGAQSSSSSGGAGGGGWRAGGRRLLRSALPGGGNTASGSGSRS